MISKKRDNEEQYTLAYHLHKHLAGWREARTTKRVHASEMMAKAGMFGQESKEFCPREYALLDKLKKTRPDEFLATCQKSTFNMGEMAANWVVHLAADAEKIIGNWECKHCSELYRFQPRPRKCKHCEHKNFTHHECRFTSVESGISCGVDMLLKKVGGKHKIIELKTMKDTDFKQLQAPLAEHKWRTNLYMRIVADSAGKRKNRIDVDEAIILYYTKGAWGQKNDFIKKYDFKDELFSPFKEFIVKRDDSETEKKWQHAKRLLEYRQGKKKMPLGICASRHCSRAGVCPVVDECFSGKHKGHQ